MKRTPLFEVSVTGNEYGEWQGTVTFSSRGESQAFRSLLELIQVVGRNLPPLEGTRPERAPEDSPSRW